VIVRSDVIEDARQRRLAALQETLEDSVVPARLVLSPESIHEIVGDIESDVPPSEALTSHSRSSVGASSHRASGARHGRVRVYHRICR
jgi:hypothetical protein